MSIGVSAADFLSSDLPVLDVRSEGEHGSGHIAGAFNMPLLNNEHRVLVGTCYKHKGKDAAIALGYELVNPLRPALLNAVAEIAPGKRLGLYCARGGLRSHKMAEFLEHNGYEVLLLKGGYKAYRRHIHDWIRQFRHLLIVSGYTGSGKTEVLNGLRDLGEQVLDLESLANHKGIAFGGLGSESQPCSAQFHNRIFEALRHYAPSRPLWLENESKTIGRVYLPEELWDNMAAAKGYEIELPVQERVNYIVRHYGGFDRGLLVQCIIGLSRRLGDESCRQMCSQVEAGELEPVVYRLFKYYDKAYQHGRRQRNCQEFVKIAFDRLDPAHIAAVLKAQNDKNPLINS